MEPKGPVKIVAKMPVAEENVQKFIALAEELIEKSRAEEGNIHYSLNVDKANPCLLVFTETWRDKEAIRFHNATEHFTRIVPQLGALCSGERIKDTFIELV